MIYVRQPRLLSPYMMGNTTRFQSTRPAWGRDQRLPPPRRIDHNFNPRARVGRDLELRRTRLRLAISIHTPRMGARLSVYRLDARCR